MKFEEYKVGTHTYLSSSATGWLNVEREDGDGVVCTAILPPDITGMKGAARYFKVSSRRLTACILRPTPEVKDFINYPAGVYEVVEKPPGGSTLNEGSIVACFKEGLGAVIKGPGEGATITNCEFKVAMSPIPGPWTFDVVNNQLVLS